MIPAGLLNRRVEFLTRAPVSNQPGILRGGYVSHGNIEWAHYEDIRSQEIRIGDLTMPGKVGTLTVRASGFTKAITRDHRVVIEGEEFEIVGFVDPPRPDGAIRMSVMSVPSLRGVVREMEQKGEEITVRRPGEPPIEVTARALVSGYQPDELVGGVNQGDRKVTVSVQDLVKNGFPLPLRPGVDRVVIRGRAMTISDVDDSTLRIAGVLLAYRLRATG